MSMTNSFYKGNICADLLSPLMKVVCVLYVLFIVYNGVYVSVDYISCAMILGVNLLQIYLSKNNTRLFIIFFIITYCNYSIISSNFLFPVDSYFTQPINEETTHISINILALYNVLNFLLCGLLGVEPDLKINEIQYIDGKPFVLICIWILLLFLIVFGFKRPDFAGDRGTASPIYEYAICLFVVYFYLAHDNFKYVCIGYILVFLYVTQNFLFGGRIFGVQLLLAVYLMRYKDKYTKKFLLLVISILFLFLNLIGMVRGDILGMISNYGISDFFDIMISRGIAIDTAYSAYFTSQTFVYVYDIIPQSVRSLQFVDFFIAIIKGFGGKMESTPYYNSSLYVIHYNGGLIPHFFYYYIGTWGVVLASAITVVYLKMCKVQKNMNNPYIYCVLIFVSCSVFRWYLYSPLGLLRSVFILLIVLYGALQLNKIIK